MRESGPPYFTKPEPESEVDGPRHSRLHALYYDSDERSGPTICDQKDLGPNNCEAQSMARRTSFLASFSLQIVFLSHFIFLSLFSHLKHLSYFFLTIIFFVTSYSTRACYVCGGIFKVV